MSTEWFTCVYIRQMHLNEWQINREQSIAECNTGVRQTCWVNQRKFYSVSPSAMYGVDQFMLGVALHEQQGMARVARLLRQAFADLRQGILTVFVRLTCTEQIQVRAIKAKYSSHGRSVGDGAETS